VPMPRLLRAAGTLLAIGALAAVIANTAAAADPAQLSVVGKPRAVNNAYGGLAVVTGVAGACPDGTFVCTGEASVTRSGAKKSSALGSAQVLMPPGISQVITVTLAKRAQKLLEDRGKLKIAISVSLTGPDGQVVSASNRGTVKRLKKKG
jgi:hypothetical protein